MLNRVVWWILTEVSEVLTAPIIRAVTAAVSTSETSINIYQTTRRNKPEDSHFYLFNVLICSDSSINVTCKKI
jgi:hypothetical protein